MPSKDLCRRALRSLAAQPSAENVKLHASLRRVKDRREVTQARLAKGSGGWHAADLGLLQPGDYEVTVGGAGAQSVTDVISVYDVAQRDP